MKEGGSNLGKYIETFSEGMFKKNFQCNPSLDEGRGTGENTGDIAVNLHAVCSRLIADSSKRKASIFQSSEREFILWYNLRD